MAKVEKFAFHVPSLEELAGVLQKGLKENFADAQVSVVDCPDLTQEPFNFPAKGICGKPRIADVGGVPYLIPLAQKEKVYDLNTVAKDIELPGAFILGAGAASSRVLGVNAELIPIVQTKNEKKPAINGSYVAQINPADKGCLLEKYSNKYSDCEFGLLANLYASEGQPGKVRTWIKGDFSCRTFWLMGNSSFSILKSHCCDYSKRAIPRKKYPNVRSHG